MTHSLQDTPSEEEEKIIVNDAVKGKRSGLMRDIFTAI